jgi:hypothetical protein
MDALSAQGNLSEARPPPDAYNLDGEGNPGLQRPSWSLQRQRPHWAGPIRPVDADRVGGSIPVSTPGSILVSAKVDPPAFRSWAEAEGRPDPGFTPESGLLTDCPSGLPWVPSSVFSWHIPAIYWTVG